MVIDDAIPEPTDTGPPSTCIVTVVDPPPPYPSRERRRAQRAHRHRVPNAQSVSGDGSYSDQELSPQVPFAYEHDDTDAGDSAPLLTPSVTRRSVGRPRSLSHTSTTSVAPSLARTVVMLFRTEDEGDYMGELEGGRQVYLSLSSDEEGQRIRTDGAGRREGSWFKRYFRPLHVRAYYKALFHLAVLNFPYALAAWVYLFVFTVAGTTLLMALPLGAILCFFNLIGARTFARGELALQSRFHYPLAYPAPSPPRPIFSRNRAATSAEIESGAGDVVTEQSFYKNSYAMFTDPTSYQALFYFLVIKPSITIVFSLILIVFVLPALVLVLPAPAALRAVRRLGIWQANVAIEGLYLAVR